MSPLRLAAAAFIGGFVLASGASAQTPTFTRDDHASYPGARAIATADFDRNGWSDLAHANTGRDTVTILLNDPVTGLARKADIPVGIGPFDLAAGDFTRDGIPDLAVANADSHSIGILIGGGDGRFARLTDIPTPSQNPRGITTGDINGDGVLDLVYSGYTARLVKVLLGTGAGGFTEGPAYSGVAVQPQGLATADFNHDGHLDVVVACVAGTGLRILLGNGGTAFTGHAVAGAGYLNVVAAGDLNADGWEDAAAASTSGSTVSIYLGSAAGLTHARTYVTGPSPRGVTIADVNGDGAPDVVTANRASSTVSVLLGDRAHPGAFHPHLEVGAGTGSRDVVAADFDADGRIDLATGNEYAASATVLLNSTHLDRAARVFTKRLLGTPSGIVGGPNDVWPADLNRDGRLDAVTLADEDPWTMSVLLAGGPTVSLPGSGAPDGFAVADFDADGNPDVLYKGCCPGTIDVYLGDGHGGFTAAPRTPVPTSLLMSFVVADMNRDTWPDLLFVGANASTGVPRVHEMMGHGDGTFHTGLVLSLGSAGRDIRAVDFNRDGMLDIAVLRDDGTLQIWSGNGLGGASDPPVAVTFASMTGADDVKFGDLNRDGYPDAVAAHGGGVTGEAGRVGVALGRGDRFEEPAYLEVSDWGLLSKVFVLADLNVDGTLDIVTAGGDFLPGNGDGTFGPNEPFDYRAVGLRVVDFTRDGLPDVVFGTSMGEIGVLVNQRNGVNRPPSVTAGPDVTIPFEQQAYGDSAPFPTVVAVGEDPDLHRLSFEWRDGAGAIVSGTRGLFLWKMLPGTYPYTLTVSDGRGAVVTDSVVVTIAPTEEIVLHFCDDTVNAAGNWSTIWDPGAAICRAYDANLGAPKVTTPSTAPANNVTLAFIADPTQTYKLWVRLKADRNSWANDSVWVQFSGSTDLAGSPRYRTGTTSGLEVSLEECVHCGVAGWGWQDDGWGAVDRPGVLLRFPEGGAQSIVIQTREDGVSIDHVVLSARKYLSARPGAPKNDATILKQTYTPF